MNVDATLAMQMYDKAKRGTGASEPGEGGPSFTQALSEAAQALRGTLQAGEQASMNAATGKGDTQSMVEALSATELALQTAVTVRDKVVEAYQEILRMPV